MKKISLWLAFLTSLLLISTFGRAQIFVTNTNDAGVGSLRAAVLLANANPGPDQIEFSLPIPSIITIDAELLLTSGNGDETTINGDIDGDFKPDISIDNGATGFSAFRILGKDNSIQYLHIFAFDDPTFAAITIDNVLATGNQVIGCYVGTDLNASGAAVIGNFRGISIINGASGNTIGNGTVEGRNIIGNNSFGIYINGSDNNTVIGNIVGLDITGTFQIQNGGPGIEILSSNSTNIGGTLPDELNVISRNGNEGISVGLNSTGTRILGNYIGTDLAGDTDLGNGWDGIGLNGNSLGTLVGDGTAAGRNIISGNGQSGIEINSSNNNEIKGNYIGMGQDGLTALPNTGDGILIQNTSTSNSIGGDRLAGEGNIISGNGSRGIGIQSDLNFIYGNVIGLSAAAGQARGNSNAGITVLGNNNEIGDALPGYGNVISSNSYGIGVTSGSGTIIEGNIIGMNGTGVVPRGNLNEGIRINGTANTVFVGDGTPLGANYISANTNDGILIRDPGVTAVDINYNFIGTQSDGITPLGNGGNGITIDLNSSTNLVRFSTITDNGGNGIEVAGGATGNIFTQNSIYSNANEGIVSSQVHGTPLVISVITPSLVIQGNSAANATIEIYVDAEDEGQVYLATVVANGGGNWSYNASPADFPGGLLNITATQLSGGFTSNFATPPFDITTVFDPYIVINTGDNGPGSLRWCIENSNADAALNTISFNIPIADPNYVDNAGEERWTISPVTNLPQITDPVILDATTQPGGGNFRIALDGQGTLSSGLDFEFGGSSVFGFYITQFGDGIDLFYLGGGGSTIGAPGMGNTIVSCINDGIVTALPGGNIIQGNFIGTDENGSLGLGNGDSGLLFSSSSSNTIGGLNPGEGNVISGNGLDGIRVNAGGTQTVEGNLIGTDPTGTFAIPNNVGIAIGTSGNNVISGNIISGNTTEGLRFSFSNTGVYQDNKIGVAIDGTSPLPNETGIRIFGGTSSDNNIFGGTGAGEPNIIAYNINQGIFLDNANHEFNQFIANSIFANGEKGIDLNGVANQNKTSPIITAIGPGTVSGTGNDGDVIHVYRDNTGNTGPLQGQEYLGSAIVASGNWIFSDGSILGTDALNATATDGVGNTSEFAINFIQAPVVYNATQATTTDFIANFSVPALVNDILIDVDDDADFSSPLLIDVSAGLTGSATLTLPLTPGIDYYYRVRSQYGASFSSYATSISFRVEPGNALDYDGLDDFVDAGNDAILYNHPDLTIETWIKPTYSQGNDQYIIASTLGAFGAAGGYQLMLNTVGQLQILYRDNSYTDKVLTTVAISPGTWTHVAGVFETTGGNTQLYIYINGSLALTNNLTGNINYDAVSNLFIGSNIDGEAGSNALTREFEGDMDELRIWGTVRTLPEIQNNRFNTLTGNEPGLIAYYRFDQGIAGGDNTSPPVDLLPDRSTNTNDGLLNNFTLNGLTSNWVESYQYPTILSVDPLANSFGAAGESTISITFSDNIDGATVDNSTFIVTGEESGIITGTFAGGGTNIIDFDHVTTFKYGEVIRVTLTSGIQSSSGIPLSGPYSFQFIADNLSGPETPDFFVDSPFGVLPYTIDAKSVKAADIDGDGDIDLVAAGESDNKIAWYEHDGSFGFTEHVVSTNAIDAQDIFIADVDSDGDLDLVSGSSGDNKIAWYDNDGTQNFTEKLIFTSASIFNTQVFVIDLDGDGDMDVLSTSDGSVDWHENDGSEVFSTTPIASIGGSPWGVYPADLDGDGDLDFVTTSFFSDEVLWYENDGAQAFAQHLVSSIPDGPWGVFAIDFDSDGDMDIISSAEFGDEIAWYQNDGVQSFTRQVITSNVDGVRSFIVKDIDDDNDLDVATASDNDSKVAWFENDGAFSFTEHIVTTNLGTARGLFLTDLDLDSDLDIVATGQLSDEIRFYVNDLNLTPPPTLQADGITFSGLGANQADISWTNGDGMLRIVVVKALTAVDSDPLYGTSYPANPLFGAGAQIGTGNFVVYNGIGNSMTLTGLAPGITYHVRIYEYNGSAGDESYLLTTGTANPASFTLGPEITSYLGVDNTGTQLFDGQITSVDFGSASIGNNIDLTFAIENIGTTDLTVTSITTAGPAFNDFGSTFPLTIAAGNTSNFIIRLNGASTGTFNETVTIANDDLDEAVFDFPVTGSITLSPEPEISVVFDPSGSNLTLIDGQATNVDFGSEFQGTDIIRTFAIENIGSAVLNIGGITVTGSDFSILSAPTTVAIGATETFDVILNGANLGAFNDVVTIQNDDTDEAAFDFPITGVITLAGAPEIEIFEGPDNTGTPVINGQATAVDFGTATIGTDIDFIFTVENTGTADLNITLFNNTGAEFSLIDGVPAPVTPGAFETFTYRLSGASAGTFNGTITLTTDDPDEGTFTFPITGTLTSSPEINLFVGPDNTGTAILDGQASAISFGSAILGTDIFQDFTIENTGTGDLTVTSITVGPGPYSVVFPGLTTITAGSTSTFSVQLSGASIGTFITTVSIFNDDPDEGTFDFQVSGSINLPLEAEIEVYTGIDNSGLLILDDQSTSLGIGSAPLGTSIDQIFAIENLGNTDLIITGISVTGTEFALQGPFPPPIPVGSIGNFTIRLNGTTPGTFSATVIIDNNDPDESSFSFPISGTIQAPEMEVFDGPDKSGTMITSEQAPAIDFGSAVQGTDIDRIFTIENTGSLDLNVTGISVSGSEFSVVNGTTITITPGGLENFTLRLSGTSAGVYTETVLIANDDFDESTFNFSVTGTILAPAITIKNGNDPSSPIVTNGQSDPVNMGQTPQFQSLDKEFLIENTGSSQLNIQTLLTDNPLFEVINIPTSIAPGASATFTIRLNATFVGIYNTTVTIITDAGIFTFPVTGEVVPLPEDPPIIVYNAVTPNGDNRHDYLRIENIEAYPGNKVIIYTKLGDKVFEIEDYLNSDSRRRFEGYTNEGDSYLLTNGTYYYVIIREGVKENISGFFVLSQ